jgi:glycosyltransferase involved in cell wall biosynthesis
MDWMPNIEGVRWFVEQVLPQVRQKLPKARLLIIGRNPPEALRRLAETDVLIEFTGTVDDVRPHLSKCQVMVVPLLSGGGTRIKLLEIMAAGRAVVSTTVGAEGLGLEHKRHLLLADTPETFASGVLDLLKDVPEAQAMSERAWHEAACPQSWQAAGERFVALARRVL